ncbi:1-acyl-sn-glycerol-3-phosphate acyltransferase [Amycolatopsis endophytica]|uniref:1-acyl-sn-glycerol-3-phosphate acyltransferase n=1 Tax=Amycolatopsis endophytica TaxID=860233 RepID=A0A853AZ87_9PSEU|nr:lysophospholipid acyltransferase family protein [Amycolatopsis endophytica]NYI88040.1 1-acyl-sn-glycerol-3-phosphate acyltransferase [Amycolatopsis endophytica]
MRRWLALSSVLAGVRRGNLRPHARGVLDALGIALDANTDLLRVPGGTGTLVVANHVSWLDIVAVLAVDPVGFLAKREVRSWPVIGPLAQSCGTRFIGRRELRELPTVVAGLADALRAGESVVVFPEGTTWCGGPGGTFRRAAFQAAIDAGAPVRPVTFSYTQGGRPSTVAAFVGDDGLLPSLARVARARDLRIGLTAHPPLDPVGDRRGLAAHAQDVVRSTRVPAHA